MARGQTYKIAGPATGSSSMKLVRDEHNRVRVLLMNDFGATNGVFDLEGARLMRDALTELLEE